ncbi:dihydroneopterin aldolase [Candidatus Kinetoplastidibacterium crithidiae]|uniref:dihydroneopterin aldolase n=1 Tax=Candidatus Kinetoplastidibacterium crithidiae TCC036E TaxID=1208918 RepID=M1LVR5_9PROT|nr:dihydroneopterin aldolase [Candidatus Kinetoplastibacterium crithidii]AFZ83071.1 dihydroneopterin aldolase [Candidatus Kinetoplastibacterium crithidii (ex Angomonas deanei ATCC 30255)]AGF47349.1 dihydroneopterin aldolase [Candidatus Kinetoplastibacterium crithidii TCC036E]
MTYRNISISNLTVETSIGILEHEINKKQTIVINANFNVKHKDISDDNDIKSILDYRELRNIIIEETTKQHIKLVETLLDKIKDQIIKRFPEIESLNIKIEKPMAFQDCSIGVEIHYP